MAQSARILGALMLFVAGCGDDGGDESAPPPIPSTILAGTVAGKPFTAKTALARDSVADPKKKSITIYDVDGTCEQRPTVDRYVLTTPVWQVGAEQDVFSIAFNDFSKSPGLIGIAESSQIEVVAAPTEIGAKGKLRLRASYEQDFVEGEVDVVICP